MKDQINNIIVVSDIHAGCRFGLMPPEITLDEGTVVKQSLPQRFLWQCWNEFWDDWVPRVTRKEPYIVVINGDIIDGVHHNSVTPVSHNLMDQEEIAYQLVNPLRALPKFAGLYMIRGTEAHVGKSAQEEERLAKRLKAEIDKDTGTYSRWEMWLNLRGSLIHFTHHVGTTNSAAYESTAVFKELVEAFNESGRWRKRPPDCVVRSHRHRAIEIRIPTLNTYGISLVTPAWQLKTPFVYKGALGRSSTPQIGGYLIRHGDEDLIYTRHKIWTLERTKEVKI